MLITIYWLGKKAREKYSAPPLNLDVFEELLGNSGYFESSFVLEADSEGGCTASLGEDTSRFANDSADVRANILHSSITSSDSLCERRWPPEGACDNTDSTSTRELHSRYCQHSSDDVCVQCASQRVMPVRHHASSGSDKELRYSASKDSGSYMYESMSASPGWQHEDDDSRFRYSGSSNIHSTSHGSLDGSAGPRSPKYSGGGGSGEYVPPTRAPERRTSTPAYDPLQFIKGQAANPLAETAKQTAQTMQKQKELKKAAQVEDADWQSVSTTAPQGLSVDQ